MQPEVQLQQIPATDMRQVKRDNIKIYVMKGKITSDQDMDYIPLSQNIIDSFLQTGYRYENEGSIKGGEFLDQRNY
jgi:hypothetical protein